MKRDGARHITYEFLRDLGFAFAVVLVLIYVIVMAPIPPTYGERTRKVVSG